MELVNRQNYQNFYNFMAERPKQVSQHTCKAGGQPLLRKNATQDSEWNLNFHI